MPPKNTEAPLKATATETVASLANPNALPKWNYWKAWLLLEDVKYVRDVFCDLTGNDSFAVMFRRPPTNEEKDNDDKVPLTKVPGLADGLRQIASAIDEMKVLKNFYPSNPRPWIPWFKHQVMVAAEARLQRTRLESDDSAAVRITPKDIKVASGFIVGHIFKSLDGDELIEEMKKPEKERKSREASIRDLIDSQIAQSNRYQADHLRRVAQEVLRNSTSHKRRRDSGGVSATSRAELVRLTREQAATTVEQKLRIQQLEVDPIRNTESRLAAYIIHLLNPESEAPKFSHRDASRITPEQVNTLNEHLSQHENPNVPRLIGHCRVWSRNIDKIKLTKAERMEIWVTEAHIQSLGCLCGPRS